jgi:Zn-dependent alcohol dehydrogenase
VVEDDTQLRETLAECLVLDGHGVYLASDGEEGLALLRRGGTLVVVGMPASGEEARFDPTLLAHEGMRIVGTKMGSALPADDIPQLVALYEDGRLKLDELVTATYPLDEINEAADSMRRGEAVRNVIVF